MHPIDFKPEPPFLDLRDYGPIRPGLDGQHSCVCGSDMFLAVMAFHNYEINTYLTEGRCVECGAKVILPTVLDDPDYDEDEMS